MTTDVFIIWQFFNCNANRKFFNTHKLSNKYFRILLRNKWIRPWKNIPNLTQFPTAASFSLCIFHGKFTTNFPKNFPLYVENIWKLKKLQNDSRSCCDLLSSKNVCGKLVGILSRKKENSFPPESLTHRHPEPPTLMQNISLLQWKIFYTKTVSIKWMEKSKLMTVDDSFDLRWS